MRDEPTKVRGRERQETAGKLFEKWPQLGVSQMSRGAHAALATENIPLGEGTGHGPRPCSCHPRLEGRDREGDYYWSSLPHFPTGGIAEHARRQNLCRFKVIPLAHVRMVGVSPHLRMQPGAPTTSEEWVDIEREGNVTKDR